MKETDFNEAQESKEENIDVKELLFKYLIHWPWFVGAVVACLIAAWVYLYIAIFQLLMRQLFLYSL